MQSRRTELRQEGFRKAFSLMELLIVILIISIVYFLGFSSIEKRENTAQALTPLNLKSSIQKSALFQGMGTFICIDNCKSCYLRRDVNSPFEAYENAIDLKGLESYTLDSRDALLEMEYGRYQDEAICLVLHFYANGSSTQLILKQEDDIYFLPAFFDVPQKVASLDEAKELWLEHVPLVSNSGEIY